MLDSSLSILGAFGSCRWRAIDPAIAAYGVSLTGCGSPACCWPTSSFANGGMHGSQFLLLSSCFFSPVSFFFQRPIQNRSFFRWWWAVWLPRGGGDGGIAGSCGLLAALTRFVGVLLVVPLAWEWLTCSRNEVGKRTLSWRTLPASMLPVVGFWNLLLDECGQSSGDPFAYFHGQQHWGRHLTWFWGAFAKHSFWSLEPFYRLWFAATLVGTFGLLIGGCDPAYADRVRDPWNHVRIGLPFRLRCRGAASLFLRRVSDLYRCRLDREEVAGAGTPLLALSVALQAVSVILFVNGYWFT